MVNDAAAAAQQGGEPTAEQAAMAGAVKILNAYGMKNLAELAQQKTLDTRSTRQIVVVGEVKRGKSTLVNALLELPDASPVDVDVTTSASLHMVPESEAHPRGWADLVFPGETRRVPGSELAEWVTQRGRYVLDPATEALPTRAVVPVRTNPFDGAVVVDTPGAGGLDSTHAQLAQGSAQSACVLVVVADASAPLTKPEMEFVKSTSATVESIVVVVSKTDKNLRRWRAIVEKDRQLLKEHLNRDLPVIGVSSVRALAACELPSGARRDGYLATSGIEGLREMIRERLVSGENHGVIDGMRTALSGLNTIRAKVAEDVKVAKEGEKALPELTEKRERLDELKRTTTQWEVNLTRDMTFARTSALDLLDRQLEEIRQKWTNKIQKNGITVLRKNPQVFTAEIEADLMGALGATMELFVDKIHEITKPLFDTPEPWADIYQKLIVSLAQPDHLRTGVVMNKRHGLIDPTLLSAGMGGVSVMTMVLHATVAAAATVAAPVAIGVAAVWTGINLGFRAMKAGRANLLTWLRETLSTTKMQASRMLESGMADSRTEIVVRYRNDLRERTEDITKQLNAVQTAAKQDAAAREKTLARYAHNQKLIEESIGTLESEIKRLSVLRPVSVGRHALAEGAAS